jgi:formiminotetrahydrofolate cyclodeaminase
MAVGGLRAGVEPFIEQLAAPTATPGGGSTAAAAGAMAAALATMVASMSRGKKAYAQFEPQLAPAIARLATLREELKSAIDADADAYTAVMQAFKAVKAQASGADLTLPALQQATSVPLGVAEHSAEIALIADSLIAITNPNMRSDLTTSIALAKAALQGALANVTINLASLPSGSLEADAFAAKVRERLVRLKQED